MNEEEAVREQAEKGFGPWNPGLGPELPRHLLPLSTIFRKENVFTTVDQARELKEFTGLELQELVVFRPERLVVHELLIRITTDLSVPAGNRVEDLGINFRRMADRIHSHYIEPQLESIVAEYEKLRAEIADRIADELTATLFPAHSNVAEKSRDQGGWFKRLFGKKSPAPPPEISRPEYEEKVRRKWAQQAHDGAEPIQRAVYRALSRAVSAMHIKHGRVWADRDVLARLAEGMACNDYGSWAIGKLIEPLLRAAAEAEGYKTLLPQSEPVVLNTKGASGSGKSSLRSMQESLVERNGASWADFALISPDIWRKYLLDYDSLGSAYKYAGSLTGVELEIIDHKLDRFMTEKADCGQITHLLIDRFRFDSFALESAEAGSNLLTRFGHLIYMFFLITPPHETVERAWLRGLEFGRYKSVEDLLAHNVEAYSGMPELFFTWILRTKKSVHYEFLDNGVPKDSIPRTVAFGWNEDMNILDVKHILDVERYRKINVHATCPEAVYPPAEAMAAEHNALFLLQCIRRIPNVNFVHWESGRVYARFEAAKLMWVEPEVLKLALRDPDTRAGLLAVAPEIDHSPQPDPAAAKRHDSLLDANRFHTLGRWGKPEGTLEELR